MCSLYSILRIMNILFSSGPIYERRNCRTHPGKGGPIFTSDGDTAAGVAKPRWRPYCHPCH